MKIESNYSYLNDGGVLDAPSRALCVPGLHAPAGVWLTAARDFHLRGGWGGAGSSAWSDDGAAVKAGQRFRLASHGSADCAAVWEIED